MTPPDLATLMDGDDAPYRQAALVRWVRAQQEPAVVLEYLDRVWEREPEYVRLLARHLACFDPSVLERLVDYGDDEALRALVVHRDLSDRARMHLARWWIDCFLEDEGDGRYARALMAFLQEGFTLGPALRGRLLARIERRDRPVGAGADLVAGRALHLLQADVDLSSAELDRLDGLLPDLTWQRLLPTLVSHPGAGPLYWHGLVGQAEATGADGAALIASALARCPRATNDPAVRAFLFSTDALPLDALRTLADRASGAVFSRLVGELAHRNPEAALDLLDSLDEDRLAPLDAEHMSPLLVALDGDLRARAIRLLGTRAGRADRA